MKKFIAMILTTATFFVGLGSLIEGVGAKFKSDQKALELIAKARQAIGGDAAIANVRSMTIVGKVSKTFDLDGAPRTEEGNVETSFEMSGKMNKMIKLGRGQNSDGAKIIEKKVDVIVFKSDEKNGAPLKGETSESNPDGIRKVIVSKQNGAIEEVLTEDKSPIILKKSGGVFTTEDGKNIILDDKKVFVREMRDGAANRGNHSQNELLRTTLALLLTAPEGLDISYVYAGEGSVDGNACNIIEAQAAGSSIKIYLDQSNNLPRMMTYQGMKPFVIKINKADGEKNAKANVFAGAEMNSETVEYQVKFSDYRTVNGLQLPFRQTQSVAGKEDETIDVTSYEINPANISEKFKEVPMKIFVNKKKS